MQYLRKVRSLSEALFKRLLQAFIAILLWAFWVNLEPALKEVAVSAFEMERDEFWRALGWKGFWAVVLALGVLEYLRFMLVTVNKAIKDTKTTKAQVPLKLKKHKED